MTTGNSVLGVIASAIALACLASPAMPATAEKESAPPEMSKPMVSALATTDAALRAKFAEYVGLSKNQEGSVFLTFSKGANLDDAANVAREVWTETSGKEGKLPNFEFIEAAATPEELQKVRVAMRDVLTIKGVVFLDLDESCGCIVVGAATKEVNPRIASFIKELGIDTSWVNIVQTPEYRLTAAALTDKFRPTMGGQQIRTVANSCTLGLPVYSWDMHNEGILTASHCTQGPQGQNWGTDFFQGPSSADFIASESIDLGLFDNTKHPECPTRRFCRFSDAVYAHYGVANAGIRGRISRPTNMCNSAAFPCFLTLDRPTDDIRIAYATAGMFAGTEVDKIGMRSGWTRGPITNTCVDVNVVEVDAAGVVNPTDITMLCQSLVATIAQPGDSGAPVFEYYTGYDAGNFAGILWGANLNFNSMVFSPIDGIQKDLGNFTFDQAGLDASFDQDGEFYTSNVDDRLMVKVERGVVPSDQIEVVLVAAPGISARKDIILEEGRNGVNGRWTIWTSGTVTTARNGLYTYQLPGGFMEFRKRVGNNNNNGMEYVEPHASRRFHGSHGTVRSIRHPQTYAA